MNSCFRWQLLRTSLGIIQGIFVLMPCTGRDFPVSYGNHSVYSSTPSLSSTTKWNCCQSKPTGEQRQATRGAGRLPGLLVGPGPSVNGPEVRHMHWLDEVLGVPPDLYLIRKVKKSFVSYFPACIAISNISPSRDRLLQRPRDQLKKPTESLY
jgi:hypothetical protein